MTFTTLIGASPAGLVLCIPQEQVDAMRLQCLGELETVRAERDKACADRDAAQEEARLIRLSRNAWRVASWCHVAFFWLFWSYIWWVNRA